MRQTVLTVALLAICIISCSDDNLDRSLIGSWTVVSFENLTTGAAEFKTEENSWGKDIKVAFDDKGNAKTISGINITNEIFGNFDYVGQNQFMVSNLGSTKVYQPRWADEFLVAFLDPNLTFTITDGTLVIYYDNNSKSVTLKRG